MNYRNPRGLRLREPATYAAGLDGSTKIGSIKLSAEILAIFATCRTRDLYDAVTRGSDWPAEWVADIHSSYRSLALHGAQRVEQAAAHIDWLVFMKAFTQEGLAIDRALAKFPEDADVQECWRRRLLREEGRRMLDQIEAELRRILDERYEPVEVPPSEIPPPVETPIPFE